MYRIQIATILRSLTAAALLLTSACDLTGENETPDAGQHAEPPEVFVCQAMPASKVQPILDPISDGRALAPPTEGHQMCSYRIPETDQLAAVQALIDYAYVDSAADAQASVEQLYQDSIDRGLTNVEWITGYGEKAFISKQVERVGIKLARGGLVMQINVGKTEATFETLAPVVRELASTALEQMPAY